MYKRQPNKGQSSTNHDVTTNQFAPRRFVIQPQPEEAEQTPADLQAKSQTTPVNHFANIPIFPPGYQPPPPPRIQMKLTIGEPGDKYEQEADRLAADVVERINSPETPPVQAQQPEEELRKKSLVQSLSDVDETSATPDLEASIQRTQGSGQPLAETIKAPMEQAFGADFSGVKIHTDAQSDQMNQSIQAKAFTTGQDIFFRQGTYEPGSRGGQELIAHELTHVVQQNGSTVQAYAEKVVQHGTNNTTIQRDGDPPEPNAVATAVQEQADEEVAKSQIKAALEQWDTSQKNAFLQALPEKFHRLVLAAGMEILEKEGLEYEKGILKTNGNVRHRMEAYKPFYQWLYKDGEEPKAMNCWETVLYAGYKVGKLSKEDIMKLINRIKGATALARQIIANPDGSIVKPSLEKSGEANAAKTNGKYFIQDNEVENLSIPIGKVIIFGNEGQHVALSAGGSNIYENDSDPGNWVKSTLSAALERNRREYGVALYWGDLPT
ncbi:DUF4157 domain-containing protein [Nostoc sp. LEGE 06077]|uniref:eCIS core domain-containing protein n=1 Tax=Nostoc sp. LEGE 06077 TaxID=915325 RepID=UPI001882ED55|nr:DUF4157 domain-containing protein [Nostoc sp. LEGE 06077]MBE9206287.1 DUF4157 domain-containing protein [Nostoc sp. LEGE 06077]